MARKESDHDRPRRHHPRPVKTLPTEAEQRALFKVTGQHVDGFRDHVIFSVAMGTACAST